MGEDVAQAGATQDLKRLRKALNVFDGYISAWRNYAEDQQEEQVDETVLRLLGKYIPWIMPYLEEDDPLAEATAVLELPELTPEGVLQVPGRRNLTYRATTNILVGLVNGLKDEFESDRPSRALLAARETVTVSIDELGWSRSRHG